MCADSPRVGRVKVL